MNYWIVPYNEEVFRLEDLLCRTDIVEIVTQCFIMLKPIESFL